MKQNASIDASFWINSCSAKIIEFLPDYFQLYSTSVVAKEVRYPLETRQIQAHSSITFNRFVDVGFIILQDPIRSIDWFQAGENAAIGLALEFGCFLLIDDANPYHRAKSIGLHVVGTMEMIVLLFDHGRLSHEAAIDAIKQTQTSKPQQRDGFTALEMYTRRKRNL